MTKSVAIAPKTWSAGLAALICSTRYLKDEEMVGMGLIRIFELKIFGGAIARNLKQFPSLHGSPPVP